MRVAVCGNINSYDFFQKFIYSDLQMHILQNLDIPPGDEHPYLQLFRLYWD